MDAMKAMPIVPRIPSDVSTLRATRAADARDPPAAAYRLAPYAGDEPHPEPATRRLVTDDEPAKVSCCTTPPTTTSDDRRPGAGAATPDRDAAAQRLDAFEGIRAKETPLSRGPAADRRLRSRTKSADLTGRNPADSTFLCEATNSGTSSCCWRGTRRPDGHHRPSRLRRQGRPNPVHRPEQYTLVHRRWHLETYLS